jgi:hypothetical protein
MVVADDVGSVSYFAYHARRAEEERRLAERATDIGAKRAHAELADRHQALANGDMPQRHSWARR